MVTLSAYKVWIFLGAAIMLTVSGILIYRPKGKVACSVTVARKVIQSGNRGYILETASQEHFVLKAEDKSVFNKIAGMSYYVITGKVK